MPTLRYATVDDAVLITWHRRVMFVANNFGTEAALDAMSEAFEPWVRERLAGGTYIGLLLEEADVVVASAGIYRMEFPPHWMHAEPERAYILNVYTAPEARGRGLAKHLMELVHEECARLGLSTIVLHASPMGRPMYTKMGYASTTEMMLRLAK